LQDPSNKIIKLTNIMYNELKLPSFSSHVILDSSPVIVNIDGHCRLAFLVVNFRVCGD
jgi:hypothetical protein